LSLHHLLLHQMLLIKGILLLKLLLLLVDQLNRLLRSCDSVVSITCGLWAVHLRLTHSWELNSLSLTSISRATTAAQS
jgi:hypothetical protein